MCETCCDDHTIDQCPTNSEFACFVGQQRNKLSSNTYNPGWRNHQNFSWGGKQQPNNTSANQQGGYQQNHQPAQNNNTSTSTTGKHDEGNDAKSERIYEKEWRSNLEIQMGQLAIKADAKQLGTLPSNTEAPTRDLGKGQCNTLTLKSGKHLEDVVPTLPLLEQIENPIEEKKNDERQPKKDSASRT